MVKKLKFALLINLILLSGTSAFGQKSVNHTKAIETYNEALNLYSSGKYGSARTQFNKAEKEFENTSSLYLPDISFYKAICSKEMGDNDALTQLEQFINEYPGNNKQNEAYYHLGDLYLNKRKASKALRYFKQCNANKLPRKYREPYKFKRGYCHFSVKDYDEASMYLTQVKDNVNSKYYAAANYYYGYIQYTKGNYQTAIECFNKIKDDRKFSKETPYYIAQIYFLQEDYNRAIESGVEIVNTGKQERQADMNRIVGQSYFQLNDYEKAIPYLRKTIELEREPTRNDYFFLGFSYYYTKDYKKAISNLSRVTGEADELAQNVYYHLADCYLQIDDKKRARVAFEAATRYEFNKDIGEDALFNTIKLNYELSYSPFNEIIDSFLSFIEKYPNSDKVDLAYDYLGQVFLSTRNYKSALEVLDKIKTKNARIYEAIQRISYFHALNLFKNQLYPDAELYLTQSLKYKNYDKEIERDAYYWRGEARYRQGKFDKAASDYNSYILLPNSFGTLTFATAHYNLGYAEFKQLNYTKAQQWWRKYVSIEPNKMSKTVGDAYNRIGDTYFVQRKFKTAITYYDKATETKASPDYSAYQKALCLGILNNQNGKVNELKSLVSRFPKSPYVDDSYYEMGRSYVSQNKPSEAINAFKTIERNYPKSSFVRKAQLELGLVYYNSNDSKNSMTYYKRVISNFPGTSEAKSALTGVRNIYMDNNDLNSYVAYTNTLGSYARLDASEQDSLSYFSAEKYYMEGDCQNATPSFQQYLENYPRGMYYINANYYLADCLFKSGSRDEALSSLNVVTSTGRNLFTEDALLKQAVILYEKQNFPEALKAYVALNDDAEISENKFIAKVGMLRCYFKVDDNNNSLKVANMLIDDEKTAPEIVREARYIRAKSLVNLNRIDQAIEDFKILAKDTYTQEGAEAKYMVINNYYINDKKKEAETEIFDFANKGTGSQYWLARSFIILSDIYEENSEYFQASQYLISVKENYKNTDDDILPMINERLERLNKKMKLVESLEN